MSMVIYCDAARLLLTRFYGVKCKTASLLSTQCFIHEFVKYSKTQTKNIFKLVED